jgi:hypothetical protein
MTRLKHACLGLITMSSIALGQIITLPSQPVTPGATFTATIFNDTGDFLYMSCGGSPLWLQHEDGSGVTRPVGTDCLMAIPPNATMPVWFATPATGPGSSGSFALRAFFAAARLDVGAASPAFAAIRGYPPQIGSYYNAHTVAFPANIPNWEFNSTATVAHTFGATDFVRVYTPGGVVPVAAASLAGVTVPPQRSLQGFLPLAGLVPGPYTVEMTWLDPGTGTVLTSRHGIQNGGNVSVELPGGHVIPSGGSLPVALGMTSLPWNASTHYAFCVGVLPGSTPIPGGFFMPLVADAAVLASLADGIGGLLMNNLGVVPPPASPWSPAFVTGLGVAHPGPAFSGMVVRAAAVVLEPISQYYGVSQGEDLLIQ